MLPFRALWVVPLCLLSLALRAEPLPDSASRVTWEAEPGSQSPAAGRLAVFAGTPVVLGADGSLTLRRTPEATSTTVHLPFATVGAALAAAGDSLFAVAQSGAAARITFPSGITPRVDVLTSAPEGGSLLATPHSLYLATPTAGLLVFDRLSHAARWEPARGGRGPDAAELAGAVLALRWDDLAYREAVIVFTRTAVWRFTPGAAEAWTRLANAPENFAPQSAVAVGPTHVFLLGADGQLSAFHVLTRTFVRIPAGAARLSALAGDGGGLWAIVEGAVSRGRVVSPAQSLGVVDWLVILAYLGAMVWIGSWFSRGEKNASGYFLGGRQIPWWAAGLSIWATGVSAISFMAIPAKTYATNWHRIAEPMGNVIVLVGGAYLFVPLLRRLNLTTVMEHTEMRFHPSLRLVSTCFMVLMQIGGRMATTLLLPAMALSATSGMSETTSILAMGIVTTVYTAMGGFKAVIWTDVVQTVLMFGGALLTFGIIVAQVPGGVGGVLTITREFDKFRPFDWTPDLTTATVYVFGLWTVGQLLAGVTQDFAQRAFSTPNVRAAQRSMITAAVVSIPGTLIFFGTGTALFAYYHTHAAQLPPLLANDNIVPLFVVQNVPAGVAGLIIAGIFAAAMSTLSGMNSVATVIVRDFYRFTHRAPNDAREVRLARLVTYGCGALATAAALYMAQLSIASLWDNFSKVMSVLGGGMVGIGALGMLTTRANTFGVYCSIVAGSAWVLYVATATRLHFAIYGLTTLVVCVVTGYIASLLYARLRRLPPRDLTGLTVWTSRRGSDE